MSVSNNQQERPLIGGKDYVTCKLCNFKAKDLNSHINRVHKMKSSTYRKTYPGRKLVCDNLVLKRKVGVSEKVKSFCTSDLGKKVLKDANTKRVSTNLKKYGNPYPNQKLAQEAIIALYKDPKWKKEHLTKQQNGMLQKYGVDNAFKIPKFQELAHKHTIETLKRKYGVINPGQIPWVQIKIRKKAQSTPNGGEQLIISFLPKYVKYTGDGKFWLHLKDGRPKNPDFVVRPFRKWHKVIEFFGKPYHKKPEDIDLVKAYKEIGVKCLVIWDGDKNCNRTKAWEALTKIQIKDFLEESSETNTSDVS